MTLKIKPGKIEYRDKEYEIELGKIERTSLGFEDHGIFTFNLAMNFRGSGQGFGNFFLIGKDVHDNEFDHVHFAITKVMWVAGVRSWEDLKGLRLYVLREEPYGLIRGIADETLERAFVIDELHD